MIRYRRVDMILLHLLWVTHKPCGHVDGHGRGKGEAGVNQMSILLVHKPLFSEMVHKHERG